MQAELSIERAGGAGEGGQREEAPGEARGAGEQTGFPEHGRQYSSGRGGRKRRVPGGVTW